MDLNWNTFTRRVTAAAVAGAMALSLCAPALAAAPELPALPAAALSAENNASTMTYTVKINAETKKIDVSVNSGSYAIKVNDVGQTVPEDCNAVIIDGSAAGGNTGYRITVKGGAAVTLKNVNIDLPHEDDYPLQIYNATNITLVGKNELKIEDKVAVYCDSNLTLTGTGSLKATGRGGIFCYDKLTIDADVTAESTFTSDRDSLIYGIYGTTVIIQSGTVTAIGHAAGIKGEYMSIEGGTVNASGKFRGLYSHYGSVSISNSAVTATGEWHGIYGGGGVTITDSNVKANKIRTGTDQEGELTNGKVLVSGNSRVFLTDSQPANHWDTSGLAEGGTSWVLYLDDAGNVTGMPEGYETPSLDELQRDPSGWGITDISSAPSGDIGGAIAAVAVGGAAIWGGYEIATRVILNKLLPEGAAIPKNQGELALLVWNTAGRPEPAMEAPYADDTAKAAQWCVEQGYLSSTDTGRRTPKFRVIEVWNKAFPKAM